MKNHPLCIFVGVICVMRGSLCAEAHHHQNKNILSHFPGFFFWSFPYFPQLVGFLAWDQTSPTVVETCSLFSGSGEFPNVPPFKPHLCHVCIGVGS